MNLIKRTTLHYQGNTQSVYEVNLWEVEEGKYDVNFIYIQFNNYSTAGTKTNQPVSLAEAEKIFYRFIRDKKKRGYVDVFQTSDDSMSITQPFFDDVERKRVILERLENKKPSKWKLDRAIWRAGELKITEATPLLIDLLGTGEDLRDYCIAWSLGWCGDKSTIPVLTQLYENPETPEFVSRIAFEALLKLADEGTKAALQMDLIASLPLELGRLARTSSPELFEQFAVNHSYYFFAVFEKIYQIDNPYIRSSILKILRRVPFQPNYFRSIRRIFKIAEYRCDAEVFAILAYRFERVIGNFNNNLLTLTLDEEDEEEEKTYQLDNRRVYDDELKKPQPIVAYSYQTQQYFRRRVWRSLKKLGENGDANYIKMATAILLEYSDNDDAVVVRSRFSQWDNYTRNIKQYWDKYADYLTFNHILYSNSPRFFFNSKKWFPRRGCDVNAETTVREEAFPRLWEQYPQALLKLLLESQCLAVHRFAVKVLRDCEDFCTEIDIDTVIQIVYSSFDVTAAFGFELGLKRFELEGGNQQLLEYLANRLFQSQPNTNLDNYWLHEEHNLSLDSINLIVYLVINQNKIIRDFASKFIGLYIFSDETNKILTQSFICQLILLSETEKETAESIIGILIDKFTNQLKAIEFERILDLLGHEIIEVQEFAALIVINYYNRDITSKLSPVYDIVGLVSIERASNLSNENTIKKTTELITKLIQSSNEKIRKAVKIIIHRLAKVNPNLNIEFASNIINILLNYKKDEDFHKDILSILLQDLIDWETSISKETTIKLLSKYFFNAARTIGDILLTTNYQKWLNEFTTKDIVVLANNHNEKIRKIAQQIFLQNLQKISKNSHEIIAAVPLLGTYWHDTYNFAFQIFTKEFHLDEFTPQILVQLCNTDRDAGKNVLNRYLKKVQNLETNNLDFLNQIISDFIDVIVKVNYQRNRHYHSLPMNFRDLVNLLWEELHPKMTNVNQEDIFKLLNSDSSVTQDLGSSLLELNRQACIDGFSTKDIITLANSENSSIQKKARQIFLEKLADIRSNPQELLESVQLLESKWKDTRDFAYNIFNQELSIEEFTPEIIVSILESTNQKARSLGSYLLKVYLEYVNEQNIDSYHLKLKIISKLINILLSPEKEQEIYNFIIDLLKDNLQEWISIIEKQTLFKLLQSETSSVQELGGIILQQNSNSFFHQLTTKEIVELANHDILSIRQAAQRLFSQNLNRFRNNPQEMLEAVRILDAKWEDTRDFAFKIFTTEFNQQDFTSDILIAICDSNNPEARKMGRDLLARNFHEVDEEEYFIKLSEHPAQDMQKFVTNYFEKYAADNPQRLRELTPYFITVLSSVNRNRTAKKRVLSFLKTESDKTQEAAKIIAEIISKQSVTMATADKANAIEIMLKIKKKYPDVSLPIQIQPVTEERRKSLKI